MGYGLWDSEGRGLGVGRDLGAISASMRYVRSGWMGWWGMGVLCGYRAESDEGNNIRVSMRKGFKESGE